MHALDPKVLADLSRQAVQDEDAALALVGTQRLDRALAQAFFGDARRLQRDVLGDAAHALLSARALTPISEPSRR